MKIVSLLGMVLALSACSFNAIEMAAEPTQQQYDLSDPEGDGVISARDECLDTAVGAAISNNGCANSTLDSVRVVLEVNFASNSSVVESKYNAEIEKLADVMKKYPSIGIIIEGHTSLVGGTEYNKVLSEKRANAVKAILVNQYGIENDRIQTKGLGLEQPLIDGVDEIANAKNRRIVAEFTGDKEIIDIKWTIYSVE